MLALIGRGATGTVYLAEDRSLQRYVALKVLLGNLARNPSLVRSLQLEAKAAAPLQHPNIVRIYSAGVEQGIPYIAMEYVEGEPLDRFLKRQNRIQWVNAFYIGQQVAEALRYTHSRGIVHRDVKPANVLLDGSGQARLTDFGIANIQKDGRDLPEASGFLGTPHYMSPEQCEGKPVGPVSDLYSLGIMLYQMIAGELPFTADEPMALVKSIVSDAPPRLNRVVPEVPDDVARLVAHLIEKRPESRPRDAATVCEAMARLQKEGGGQSALPTALNAFIREQAQIRTLPIVAKHAAQRRKPGGLGSRVRRALRQPLAKAMGAVLVAAACTVPPMMAWSLSPAHGRASSAPVLETAEFSRPATDVCVARLPMEGFRLESLGWAGNERLVVGRVAGMDGALTQGAVGLLALDPQGRRMWSLRPPAGAAFDDLPAEVWALEAWSAAPDGVPEGTPLSNAVLVQARSDKDISLVAQKWREGAPRALELYRVAAVDGVSPVRHAVIRRDGHTLCLLLREPLSGNDFLAERDVHWDALDRVGPRLSPKEGAVLAESIQYSPDGSKIAFVLEHASDRRELWLVPSGGNADTAVRLTEGALGPAAAFSPDGTSLAVSHQGAGGSYETIVVSAADGTVEAELGLGRVGSQSWHPSGRYVILSVPDEASGSAQAWAVETAAPQRRARLPQQVPGANGPWAISRNGAWAASPGNSTGVSAVFLELGEVEFEG